MFASRAIYAVVMTVVVGQNFWPSISALDLFTAPKLTAWPFDHSKYYSSRLCSNCWIYSLTPWWATWPLDPCLQCLYFLDFILTAAKAVTKGMYMEVTILVPWEDSLLVACYSIQLFNSDAHIFVWCSYANKDNPIDLGGSTLEHLLQNWTVVIE